MRCKPGISAFSRGWSAALAGLVMALSMAWSVPASAGLFKAGMLGWDRSLYGGLVRSTGTRYGKDGGAWIVRLEGAVGMSRTVMRSPAGMSFGADVGIGSYEGKSDSDWESTGLELDAWFGFPVGLLEFGAGRGVGVRLCLEPGLGISILQAYAYVKVRAQAQLIPDFLQAELSWRWSPGPANYSFHDGAGEVNGAEARANVYFRFGDSFTLTAFAALWQSDAVKQQAWSAVDGAPAGDANNAPSSFKKQVYEELDRHVQLGAGIAW